MVKKHQITSMIYYGVSNCGLNMNPPIMKKLFSALCNCIIITEKQKIETDNVCKAFSENGIDHMLLKGAILREMYPQADMRLMGDVDIFIKTEQYDRIKKVMTQLGFIETTESDHEYIWKKNEIVIELHKRLIPSYNKDYYAYYGDGWKLAIPSGTMLHRYEMSAEDQMIYLFTHFAKHYRDGGIGCRHVLDLWVYLRSFPNLDEAYIRTELRKLQLLEFHDNVRRLLNVWFEDGVGDDRTAVMTGFIFDSGSWGAAESHTLSQEVKRRRGISSFWDGKILSVWLLLFPTADDMTRRHPILEKAPWLLPVMWPVRWLDILLFKREKLGNEYREYLSTNAEKVDAKQRAMNYVGLDFHFKEKTPQ